MPHHFAPVIKRPELKNAYYKRANKPLTQWCVERVREFLDIENPVAFHQAGHSGLSAEIHTFPETVGSGRSITDGPHLWSSDDSEGVNVLEIWQYQTRLLQLALRKSKGQKKGSHPISVIVSIGSSEPMPFISRESGMPHGFMIERVNGILDCLATEEIIPSLRIHRDVTYEGSERHFECWLSDSETRTRQLPIGRGGQLTFEISTDLSKVDVKPLIPGDPDETERYWNIHQGL